MESMTKEGLEWSLPPIGRPPNPTFPLFSFGSSVFHWSRWKTFHCSQPLFDTQPPPPCQPHPRRQGSAQPWKHLRLSSNQHSPHLPINFQSPTKSQSNDEACPASGVTQLEIISKISFFPTWTSPHCVPLTISAVTFPIGWLKAPSGLIKKSRVCFEPCATWICRRQRHAILHPR